MLSLGLFDVLMSMGPTVSDEHSEARQEVGRHEALRRSDSSIKGRELSAPPSFVPRRPQRFSKSAVSHSLVDPYATTTRRAARGLSSRGRVVRSTHLL